MTDLSGPFIYEASVPGGIRFGVIAGDPFVVVKVDLDGTRSFCRFARSKRDGEAKIGMLVDNHRAFQKVIQRRRVVEPVVPMGRRSVPR